MTLGTNTQSQTVLTNQDNVLHTKKTHDMSALLNQNKQSQLSGSQNSPVFKNGNRQKPLLNVSFCQQLKDYKVKHEQRRLLPTERKNELFDQQLIDYRTKHNKNGILLAVKRNVTRVSATIFDRHKNEYKM